MYFKDLLLTRRLTLTPACNIPGRVVAQPIINPTNKYDDVVIKEYFAIGSEFTISLNRTNSIKLHIIPEVEYPRFDGIATIGDPEIATLTIGLSLDLHTLFAH